MIKAIIVTKRATEAQIIEAETTVGLIEKIEALGFARTGLTPAWGQLREELRGQPKFAGLYGPMWGGDETPLRYESPESYDFLSN